ncbi:MAG: InlB B-repeat-containing protein [Acidimicrobiia bacterium]
MGGSTYARRVRAFIVATLTIGVLAVAGAAATTPGSGTTSEKPASLGTAPVVAASITNPGGPLTTVDVSPDLNCAVDYLGDTASEFYDTTACATLVATGGTLYGPSNIPAGGSATPRTPYTPVSQNQTGSGSSGDPYTIVTAADAGTSGLQVQQKDTYVTGQETYRTDVTLANSTGSDITAVLYKAADCYLQNSDFGYGAHDTSSGAISCIADLSPGSRIEQFYPVSSGSHYVESGYNDVWALVGLQQPLPDECRQCANYIDNGMGLSWSVTVPAHGSLTESHLTNFSPLGNVPLEMTKTARDPQTPSGGANAYTIIVTNPNSSAVTLASISDELAAGFSYQIGSTTGATTADPTVSGATLTWPGPISVAAGGTVTLTFGVQVSRLPGLYTDQASAIADGIYTVAPTGPTAPVEVTSGSQHTLQVTVVGQGTVSSSPAGISCPTTCSAAFSSSTGVGLTAAVANGWTFSSWSGDCSGSGACVVTMDTDHSITATFRAPAPPTQAVSIDGDGRIDDPTRTSFDIDVAKKRDGRIKGSFEFSARGSHQSFESDHVDFLGASGSIALFGGGGELNDRHGYHVIVVVVGNGDDDAQGHDRTRHTPDQILIELRDRHDHVVFTTNGLQSVHHGDIDIRSGPSVSAPRFSVSPTSGGAGTVITQSSIDGCPAPVGAGHWMVQATFRTDSGNTTLGSGAVDVAPDGSWSIPNPPLTILETGPAHITAQCLDVDNLVPTVVDYEPVAFTVT